MAICLSVGGSSMYSGTSPATTMYVGTVNGVAIVERDAAGKWRQSRTSLEGKHIHALVLDPESGTLMAGVRKGGVYASADGGTTWRERSEGLGEKNIYSLMVTRAGNTTRVYAGTEPAHLFLSEDLGANWKELASLRSVESLPTWDFPAPPHVAHVKTLACDPTEPNRMYACVEQGCLAQSNDGGQSWTQLYGIDEDAHRIVVHPTRPQIVYFATGNGLYKSENRGDRWKHITPRTMRVGYPDPMLLHPAQDGLVFIAGSHHGPEVWHSTKVGDSAIARSRDGGSTWEILRTGLPEVIHGTIGSMVMEVFEGGFNLFACGTDGDIFHSADGGDHWSTIVSGVAPLSKGDHHRILNRQAAVA